MADDDRLAGWPSGIVTFVFTDIKDSTPITRKAERHGDRLYEGGVRDAHRDRLYALAEKYHGREVDRAGDGHFLVFQRADDALACVVAFQRSLAENPLRLTLGDEEWELRVRAGIHTTREERLPRWERDKVEYEGSDTNFAARVGGQGEGGQIILSAETYARARTKDSVGVGPAHPWPDRLLKGFNEPETVYEILYREGQEPREPGMRFFPEWYRGEQNRYIERPERQKLVFDQYASKARDGRTSRMVTIRAEGGMGKTRLAVACAARMAGLFKDGVHFVSLALVEVEGEAGKDGLPAVKPLEAAKRDAGVVAEAIGVALGLSGEEARPEGLLKHLHEKDLLLVLDNYETARCLAVGQFLTRLATETKGVRLLVTGREPVDVRGLEQSVSLDDGMTDEEARELFLSHARLLEKLKRQITPAEDAQIHRIVVILSERIPLAIELAAAWARTKTLKEIADGIEKTPLGKIMDTPADVLRPDDVVAHGRHRSLTRSLDWSYRLLGSSAVPHVQSVFAASGLFAHVFDVATLAAVGGLDDADEAVRVLHNASLLRRDEGDPASEVSLYRLHRFTRDYALARLAEQESGDEARRRFVAHYAVLVTSTWGKHNDLVRNALLEREWRNVAAAADLAEGLGDFTSVVSLSGVCGFLGFRCLWSEQERFGLRGLAAALASQDRKNEGSSLKNLGSAYRAQGRWAEAVDSYERSLAIFCDIDDRIEVGRALINLGSAYRSQGRWAEAIDAFERSLAIRRELGDRQGEGWTLGSLGCAYRGQGRWAEAIDAFERSLAIRRKLGDRFDEGWTLNNLGCTYRGQGRWAEAIDAFERSLAIRRDFGDRLGEGRTLGNLGSAYRGQGRWAEAIDAFERSLAIRRDFGDRLGEGWTLENFARLWEAQGEVERGILYAQQAIEVLEGTEAKANFAKAQATLARLEGKSG